VQVGWRPLPSGICKYWFLQLEFVEHLHRLIPAMVNCQPSIGIIRHSPDSALASAIVGFFGTSTSTSSTSNVPPTANRWMAAACRRCPGTPKVRRRWLTHFPACRECDRVLGLGRRHQRTVDHDRRKSRRHDPKRRPRHGVRSPASPRRRGRYFGGAAAGPLSRNMALHEGGSRQSTSSTCRGIPAKPGFSIACEMRKPIGQRALMKAITERICRSSSTPLKAGM